MRDGPIFIKCLPAPPPLMTTYRLIPRSAISISLDNTIKPAEYAGPYETSERHHCAGHLLQPDPGHSQGKNKNSSGVAKPDSQYYFNRSGSDLQTYVFKKAFSNYDTVVTCIRTIFRRISSVEIRRFHVKLI
jgi:hypothetical protein